MEQSGQLHAPEYLMLTVKLNTGTAALQVKNDDAVGFVSKSLVDGLEVVYMKPCSYQVVVTGDAVVGVS